uniref:3Fe-4S ferredoxin n=1 Tax=Paulinella chromatophora TaxID=39717 RepID=B1X3W5_PAUCH|nr:3Fe-4S ferredoxin [Paulinella chromatophora]ACB42634.1 3Fe-4S ferredoxin [Paulinella chromatophora]
MDSYSSKLSNPSIAFQVGIENPTNKYTGFEPILGGILRQKAVWVDEVSCIGCRYCSHVAVNTFMIEQKMGRSRAIRQDGDSTERIQEAIDTCPVDCIHWVDYNELPQLKAKLKEQELNPIGFPSPSRKKRY